MYEPLKRTTSLLLEYIEEGTVLFERAKSTGLEGDFYLEVKPFSDQVKQVLDEWLEFATEWLKAEKPKWINQNQLINAYDHIDKVSIQCFFPTTSRKLFIDSIQSIKFILNSILAQLNSHAE